jgi:hypothetical protein
VRRTRFRGVRRTRFTRRSRSGNGRETGAWQSAVRLHGRSLAKLRASERRVRRMRRAGSELRTERR